MSAFTEKLDALIAHFAETLPTVLDQEIARREAKSWVESSAIAKTLHARSGQMLDGKAWTDLVSALESGLPLVITIRESENHARRVTAVITELIVKPNIPDNTRLRKRNWGFDNEVYFSDIISVATPEIEYIDI